MYSLRLLAAALMCVLGASSLPVTRASAEPPATESVGTIHIVLFGHGDRAMDGVDAEVSGARRATNAQGAVHLDAPEGTHRVHLRIPRALVPEAPTSEATWNVDLPDVPVVAGETTQLIVTLSATGALAGLDLQAPEAGGARSLQREFQQALADRPHGNLRGKVVASEGGAAIEGARVYVRGAPVEAQSDATGAFEVELPAGSYALSVIHPKYSTQSVPDVVIGGGETRELKVELSPASVELDELVVTAPHIEGGVASLIAERRETTAVADVIGAEQMARSGDSSAASALARVTGLTVVDGRFVIVRGMGERYSSMTLNRLQVPSPEPTRRVVPLDIFPAGILESVVVQKTYSPDLPGEFGGGLVQVRSRAYPDQFVLNLTLSTGLNSQTHLRDNLVYEGGKRDWLGFDDGSRALPGAIRRSGKLVLGNPFTGGYSAAELERFGESLPNRYATRRATTPPDLGVVASIGNKFDLRFAELGVVAAVGYKNEYAAQRGAVTRSVQLEEGRVVPASDFRIELLSQQVSLSAFLDWGLEFSKEHRLKFTTMLLRQSEDATTLRTGYNVDFEGYEATTLLSWVERQVFLQQASGFHKFAKLRDFEANYRYAYARAARSEPDRRIYSYVRGRNPEDPARILTGSSGNERLWGELDDVTHEGALDLVQPVGIWAGLTAKVKAGALVYGRRRDASVRRFEYNISGLITPEEAALPLDQILTPANIGTRASFQESSLLNDTYDAAMDIQAGYAMLELPLLSSLELMGGARVERGVVEVSTFDQFAPDKPPELARLDDTDVLPAATLTYRMTDSLQLRGGYSRTLNRPDLRELSSGRFIDIEANATLRGNNELKRATIDSYDVRLEWYYTSDEIFSVGGFVKRFRDPIESSVEPGAELIYSFINTSSAFTRGIELEGRKRFDFLHRKLDALYLAANFSLIDSEVEVQLQQGGVYRRPLQSQSPWVVNAQLGFDATADGESGTAASLVYNVAGRRIRAVGNPNLSQPDQYEEPLHRLDFVFSQAFRHGLKLGLKAQNLLNSVQVWKQGDVVVRRFRRGVDVAASLAWSY